MKKKTLLPVRNVNNFLKQHAVYFFSTDVSFHGGEKEGTHFTTRSTLTLPITITFSKHKCKQSVPIQNKLRTKCQLP